MEPMLIFNISNQEIERDKNDEFTVVESSVSYLKAQFNTLTDDWRGMIITGIFIMEDGTPIPSLADEDGICTVPEAWLVKQKGYVGAIGSDGTTKITTRAVKVRIREKGYTSEPLEEEAKNYFDQIIKAFGETKEFTELQAKIAKRWAVGLEEEPETTKDNAAYYAKQAKDVAAGIPGQVEAAKKHIDEYVAGKEEEFKGDTGNVYFAAFKVINGRLKMYSDPKVDKVRFVREGSRLKYRIVL